MDYSLILREQVVQFLVDRLRELPHQQVDADIQSIRAQCERQERDAAARTDEQLRARVRAEIEAELRAEQAAQPAPRRR